MELIYWILWTCYIALIVITLLLIITDNSNSNPSGAIVWIILIVFLPMVGIILYFIFGLDRRRLGSSEKNFKKFIDEVAGKLPEDLHVYIQNHDRHLEKLDPDYRGIFRMLADNNYSNLLYGSDVEIITEGSSKFDSLLDDLENAKHHIHFECFIFRRDTISREIRDVLMRKASQGIEVRFLYDNIVNIDILPGYYNKMRDSGVEVRPFTKLSFSSIRGSLNNRNHRKLIVIDGKIGYIGGMNITEQTQRWRDAHLRVHGEGVYGLQMNFLQVWHGSDGDLPEDLTHYFPPVRITGRNLMQIVPEAPDTRFPYFALSLVKAIENAKKYIYIQTAYFSPPVTLMRALTSASLSGVEVRVMVSRKSDFPFMDWAIQSYYEQALEAGIRIFEIQDYFSHAKSIVMDDYLSIIGSANFDYRSMELNFEINAFMYDHEVALRSRNIFIKGMESCIELSPEKWRKRPWHKKVLQTIMRFFSPLL